VSSTATVLVVEDDRAIRRGLVDALKYGGYAVHEAEEGRAGLQMALSLRIDLALLDVVLPGLDGFAILAALRQAKSTLPVILVTARGAESDRVRGLGEGADDYVVKPFSARELLARVEAVLRRSASRIAPALTLQLPAGEVDFGRREVRLSDGSVRQLSDKEHGVLRYLATAREHVVSRDELLERVWGLDPRGLATRTIDMHMTRLREKLAGCGSEVVVTVRGQGYVLAADCRVTGG
jgi:DNA-binding response OmpR family regulator